MFFTFLGRLVRRAWPLFLAGWVALLLISAHEAPPWDEVAKDREFAFLPPDSPSRVAGEMFAKAFPLERRFSNIVLVFHREESPPANDAKDVQFIESVLRPGILKIADAEGGLASQPTPSEAPLFSEENAPPPPPPRRSIIERVQTPETPGAGAFLVSPDRRALLVVVDLTTEFQDAKNWPVIKCINDLVQELQQQAKVPAGLQIALTGSAVIGRDRTIAELQSVRATETLTIVLVIALLVIIYRAPLLALIPLVTVYLAVRISINLLTILAGAGHLRLFEGIQIYITILSYGAGVDYCLFLTARYREELDGGRGPGSAVVSAIGNVGHALTASAAAVICGIAMMYFAQFGKFRQAGIAIPLSLLIVLCATLTFSSSLLRLTGRWAYWPRRGPRPRPAGGEPGPGLPGGGAARAFSLEGLWDRVGQLLLGRAGAVWVTTVALMTPFVVIAGLFYGHLSYNMVGSLPANAPSVVGARVLEQHFAAGILGPVTMLLVDPAANFASDEGRRVVERVTDYLHRHEAELGLADVRSLTAPFGFTAAASTNPFEGLNLPEETRREATRRAVLDRYVTDLGGSAKVGTRLDLMLNQSPFSDASMADLERIEHAVNEALPIDVRPATRTYISGTTASLRDLATVIRRDRSNIQALVLASVFVILALLLRGLLVPAYLLSTVVFSYFTTLGVTFLVFWALDPHGFSGIDWKVAIFLFTILIAVGADYNIFLTTRIREEQERHGAVSGITQALDRTGPIISSCGIIMAGTFASLLGGSLLEMKQLGFALAFGVLLDTFVVRPILVPAFLILWQSGRLAPPWTGRAATAAHEARTTSRRAAS